MRLSINRKNKETGEWEREFNGYCMFIGNANAKAQQLKRQSRIKLGDVDVTNTYDKETKKEYITYKVFSFDIEVQYRDDGGCYYGTDHDIEPTIIEAEQTTKYAGCVNYRRLLL